MFSETVSSGNSCGSWYTVAMPSAIASPVEWMLTGRPSNSIVPVSADSTPEMILIMVDLPAPFSPTSACTWPALIDDRRVADGLHGAEALRDAGQPQPRRFGRATAFVAVFGLRWRCRLGPRGLVRVIVSGTPLSEGVALDGVPGPVPGGPPAGYRAPPPEPGAELAISSRTGPTLSLVIDSGGPSSSVLLDASYSIAGHRRG